MHYPTLGARHYETAIGRHGQLQARNGESGAETGVRLVRARARSESGKLQKLNMLSRSCGREACYGYFCPTPRNLLIGYQQGFPRKNSSYRTCLRTSIEVPPPLLLADQIQTPAEIVELVRVMATTMTDAQIADALNVGCLRTGRKKPLSRLIVRYIRRTYGIRSYEQHLRSLGWLTAPEMAVMMKVHPVTAKRFAHEGVLRAVRANDKKLILFEPVTGPLPKAQAGKRFLDRHRYPELVSKKRMRCSLKPDPWPD